MDEISSLRLLLQRVADALGMPVEQFFADNPRSDGVVKATETADCLYL